MRTLAFGSLLASFLIPVTTFAATYSPPAGFKRTGILDGSAIAVSPNGEVAVGTSFFSPGATIKVYQNEADALSNAPAMQTFTSPTYTSWGDLTFKDNNTLYFTDNGTTDAVYKGTIDSGAVSTEGAVPNVQGLAIRGSNVYAVAANDSGLGTVYSLAGGSASPIAALTNIGSGIIGGIAFDSAGNILITDTGSSHGQLLSYTSSFSPLTPIDLTGGNGFGAYDVALDSEGDAFVTTGSTLTEIAHTTNAVSQFGTNFTDVNFNFPFPTNLEFAGAGFEPDSGKGKLWVNGTFTDDQHIFAITPTPEPSSIALVAIGASTLLRRRRKLAVALTTSLAGFAILTAPQPANADQFFATQMIATNPGAQQQSGFTNSNLALGAPRGGGIDAGSTHVYNLGNGGSITLGFDDANPTSHRYITDGPGPDFIVSENPFDQADDPHRSFAELMFVEVSSDGTNFQRFLNYSTTPGPVPFVGGVIDPDNVAGYAGVNPVLANADTNSINPFDVATAGGDVFDLHALAFTPLVQSGLVDLQHIRYVKLIDIIGDGSTLDSFSGPIYDSTGGFINGADVDAVTVINGAHAPEPSLGLSLAVCALMRRTR